MHADGYLYLGLHGKAVPAVNVYLDRGSEIAVLHASAALGTALYVPVEGGWQRAREFAWRCRETTDSARAQQARAEFLASEGWLASNRNMGRPEDTEYQIDFSAGRLRLRPVLMTAFTTIFGMLPLALMRATGSEMWRPLGVAMVGGLLVSTLVTLVLVPTLYTIFEGRLRRKGRAVR